MDLQRIFQKLGIKSDVRILLDKWNEPHRFYHDISHLQDLIAQINEDFGVGELTENEREKLIVAAIFHDIVYDPVSNKNEENSANFFINLCEEKFDIDIVEIKQIILDTKNHIPSTPLSEKFQKYDLNIFMGSLENLLVWESGLREEYNMIDDSTYLRERLSFLENIIDRYPQNMDNILDLINRIKTKYA